MPDTLKPMTGESIFFDRYSGPMLRWLEGHDLPHDATDEAIVSVMETRNTVSIAEDLGSIGLAGSNCPTS